MYNFKQITFTLSGLLVFILSFSLSAQEFKPLEKNRAIGLVPQYAFLNGLRMDLDFRLRKDSPQWLVVAPQVYMSSEDPALWDFDQVWGLGMELQHRYFLKPGVMLPKGVYLGYGPVFQYFSIDDTRLHSEEVIENGIPYTVVRYGDVTTNLYKVGMTATAGVQILAYETVYFDLYAGAGIRFSFDDQSSGLHRIYNDWWGDYGYSGTLMTLGLRIGLLIPKR